METKSCTRCKQSLPLEQFVQDKNKRDGHASLCKPCNAERLREHRVNHLDERREYERRWYQKHIEKRRARSRNFRQQTAEQNRSSPPPIPESKSCPKCGEVKSGMDFGKCAANHDGLTTYCKSCSSDMQTAWRTENPELAQAKDKLSWQRYRSRYQTNYKRWVESNRRKRNNYRSALHEQRMQSDPNYRVANSIRKRVRLGLFGLRKSASTEKLLGCSFEECRKYIESLWQPWMCWENYGKGDGTWQIDHKIPVDAFDLTNPADQRACFHYSNLQPMATKTNRDKWHKYDPADLEALRQRIL